MFSCQSLSQFLYICVVGSLVHFPPLFLGQHQVVWWAVAQRNNTFAILRWTDAKKDVFSLLLLLLLLLLSPSLPPSLLWLIKKCVSLLSSHWVTSAVSECMCVCEKVALATHKSSAEKLQILFPLKNKKRLCGLTHTDQQKHSCFFFYSVCVYVCVYFPFVL